MHQGVRDVLIVRHSAGAKPFIGVWEEEVFVVAELAKSGLLEWQEVRGGFAVAEEGLCPGEESPESGVHPCWYFSERRGPEGFDV